MKSMYIVTAYRYGDHSDHSYTVGVFTTKRKAISCAKKEVDYRGGFKYSCEVDRTKVDVWDNDEPFNRTTTVYLLKGRGHLEPEVIARNRKRESAEHMRRFKRQQRVMKRGGRLLGSGINMAEQFPTKTLKVDDYCWDADRGYIRWNGKAWKEF